MIYGSNADTWVSFREIIKFHGISVSTGRRWIKNDTIKRKRKLSDRYLYLLPPKSNSKNEEPSRNVKKIAYCRVSSAKQADDLSRQIEFFRSQYPDYEIVKDIGSGLNYKRKGLLKIMEQSNENLVCEVMVSSKDRLCRFGFELNMFLQNNTKLVVLEQTGKDPEQEFVEDILSILQVFACRWNGKRRYGVKNKKDQVKT
jgi:predicted site-specific integrase-resolvase